MSKLYVAGKITGDKNFYEKFRRATEKLTNEGNSVINPAVLPKGFGYEEYMAVCFSMIDQCEEVALLPDWEESPGAVRERAYAEKTGRKVRLLDDTYSLCNCIGCRLNRAVEDGGTRY